MSASETLEDEYTRRLPDYESLTSEVRHILSGALRKSGIKIDSIETRVKSLASITLKASSKSYQSPLDAITDVVGARVVCLFRSDLSSVGDVIKSCFDVASVDNKVEKASDSFGYLSIHYLCSIPKKYIGPRYDEIKGITFEVQVRTLCMHAWAAVSHYLDYKTEFDIPDDMRKSLNALSGLFYVADDQFQAAYGARLVSKKEAESRTSETENPIEINLDTLSALAARLFPERTLVSAQVSELLNDIKEYGFTDLREIERKVVSVKNEFEIHEKTKPGGKVTLPFFSAVGAIRVSLGIEDQAYDSFNTKQAQIRHAIKKEKAK